MTTERIYDQIIRAHLAKYRQMVFLSGPRQVGKTTLAKEFSSCYLDWDNVDARALILKGPSAAAGVAGLERLSSKPLTVAFDEIHKYRKWKDFLKASSIPTRMTYA